MDHTLTKAAIFQLAWFGCIFAAADGQLLLSSLIIWGTALFLARGVPWPLLLLGLSFNLIGDGALCRFELLLSSEGAIQDWPPFWLMGLWVAFAAMIPSGFAWLKRRLWLAGLLGAIFGPLSYASGVKLGALQFGPWAESMMGVAVLWLVAFPALVWVGTRNAPVSKDPTSGSSPG